MIDELLKPINNYTKRKWRKVRKEAEENTAELIKLRPEHANDFRRTNLYSFAYQAVYCRDEKMLDNIAAEHEALTPCDAQFQQHVKYNRACLRVCQSEFKEAIAMFEHLLEGESYGHRSHILSYLFELYEKVGDYKMAAKYVHLYIENWDRESGKEGSYLYYGGLGHLLVILAQAREYEAVLCIGKKRVEMFDDEPYIRFLVGQTYLELKDDLRALHYFNLAAAIGGNYPEMYMNLSAFYWNDQQDFKKAIEFSLKTIETCGEDPDYAKLRSKVYQNLANLFKQAHDLDKAGEYRRKQFEEMDSLELFDLIVLFGRDKETMNEYEVWAENNPDAYNKYFGKSDEADGEDDDNSGETLL